MQSCGQPACKIQHKVLVLLLTEVSQCHWDANNDSAWLFCSHACFCKALSDIHYHMRNRIIISTPRQEEGKYLPLARNEDLQFLCTFGLCQPPVRGWPLAGACRGLHKPCVAQGLELAHDRFPKGIWWHFYLYGHVTGTDGATPLPLQQRGQQDLSLQLGGLCGCLCSMLSFCRASHVRLKTFWGMASGCRPGGSVTQWY